MCRFEPSYLAVTISKDYEISAKGHGVPHDKKRLDSAYCSRGQKCKGSQRPRFTFPRWKGISIPILAATFLVTGMQFLPRKTLREAQSIYISPAASSASCVPHKRFQ